MRILQVGLGAMDPAQTLKMGMTAFLH